MIGFPLTALLALFSCGGDGGGGGKDATPGTAAVYEPAGKDTLVIAYQSDIGNLISVVQETSADSDILTNISMPMVDSEFDCSLKKLPGIAKSWEWSDDGKILSMELRDDIQFEDGTPLTTEDIVFTYDLIGDTKVSSPRISYVQRMVEGARPKVVDATHIEWHFTEAYDRDTQMAHVSALPILPKGKLASADRATLRGHPMSRAPMATGAWRLDKYEPSQRIVLTPNEYFSGPEARRPKLNRVIFRILPEYNTRLLELESGNVDLMQSILVQDADRLRKEHPEINLYRRGWRSMDYVGWNLNRPMFADPNVRVALAHAVNTEDIIGKLLTSNTGERYARPSVGTITPALCGVHNDDIAPLTYNLQKAKTMLAAAGWTDTDGDGFLDKNGKPFEFTLTTNTGNKRRANSAILIQAQLKDVGVKVNIEKQESNTFFENLRKKDFDAALAGWSAGLFIDPSTIWHGDTPERKYEFNFVSYNNAKVNELIERGMRTPEPQKAAPIWKEMQAQIYADQPYMFLWWMDEIVGVHSRFENVQVDVLSPIHNLHEWSVPKEKVKYKR